MKSTLILILAVFAGYHGHSQSAAAYAATIEPSDLKKHIYYLASPFMEGRETATEGQRRAAAYLETQMLAAGLEPAWNGSFQQHFTIYADSLVTAGLAVNGQPLSHDSDFSISSNSGQNILMQSGSVLFMGTGYGDSSLKKSGEPNARGRVVLAIGGKGSDIRKKRTSGRALEIQQLQQAAQKDGAIALLIVDNQMSRRPMPVKTQHLQDYRQNNLPNTFFISNRVAEMIMGDDFDLYQKSKKKKRYPEKEYIVQLGMEIRKNTTELTSSNVLGMVTGSKKPDEAVIITAHYDHLGIHNGMLYAGADDDGSGTSAVLELAEAFAQAAAAGHRPLRSVIFMTVSGEEKGLWGSEHYSDHPAFPMEKTSANINIDMIGRIDDTARDGADNYIYVVGDNFISSDLRKISEHANSSVGKLQIDYKFNAPDDPERIFYRSDHYNFAKNGVPAIFYFNGLHQDYHLPSDTPEKINYELLSKRSRLIFYTAWEMANRDSMLNRDLPMP